MAETIDCQPLVTAWTILANTIKALLWLFHLPLGALGIKQIILFGISYEGYLPQTGIFVFLFHMEIAGKEGSEGLFCC